jgi:hypothetical protein
LRRGEDAAPRDKDNQAQCAKRPAGNGMASDQTTLRLNNTLRGLDNLPLRIVPA